MMDEELSKIEEMVSMYLVLDEEDRTAIRKKVYELYIKSAHKEAVLKEQAQIPETQRLSDNEIKAETETRALERFKAAIKLADTVDEYSPDDKAAFLIALTRIQKRARVTQKPNVHITVSHKATSTKKRIEELLPEADYENARRIYREVMTQMPKSGESL